LEEAEDTARSDLHAMPTGREETPFLSADTDKRDFVFEATKNRFPDIY
jgi:hypothetical protein